MSLQVWLPLTKDLRNQGLNNMTATNSGATYLSTGGKLGGCYSFDGTDDAIGVGNLSTIVDTDFSWSCWFYRSEWSSKSWETIFGGPSGFELETKSSSTNSPLMYAYSWGKGTFTYELNQWNHLVMTRTTSETKFYLNGELKLTGNAGSIPSGNYFVGSWSSTTGQNFKGKVNDVRIYDHCLSPMEVKQISQGLILHYPLNRQGWGQENLAINTGTRAPDQTSQVEWVGFKVGNLPISAGETLTISFDLRMEIGTAITNGTPYLYIYNTNYRGPHGQWISYTNNTTTKLIPIGNYAVGDVIEKRIHFTTTAANSFNPSTQTEDWIEFYSNYDTENRITITNLKIERGFIATPWCPNSADTLYTTMGLNGTTEYDCSGFCNNGTRTGTFTWISDTPKYAVSTKFDTTSSKIQLPTMDFSGMANSYTFAWWQYNVSTGNMPWGFSNGNRLNCYHCSPLCWNTGDGSSNQFKNGSSTVAPTEVQNGWHHMVVTGDGTSTKLYIDGVYRGTATTYKALTGTQIWISGWDSGTSYTFNGSKESDFRIYATALSADDVKSLYQNCATIDPDGTIRGQIRS